MSQPSVHILYEVQPGPWGGGNQFLKALRAALEQRHIADSSSERSDIILVNSHHHLRDACLLKWRYPDKSIIHRIDGPVDLIRGRSKDIDPAIYRFNRSIADGSIFQSEWSRSANVVSGMSLGDHHTVIPNAPDPAVFYPKADGSLNKERKVRLIATSWSSNPRKGFDFYKWLDNELDFGRFEMVFIGNSPMSFENIHTLRAAPSNVLADMLRHSDIFVTGSIADPCSNSLLEALHCGLPALARADGGHPELVGSGGEVFESFPEALMRLDRIVEHYSRYRRNIRIVPFDDVVTSYVDFMSAVHASRTQARRGAAIAAWARIRIMTNPHIRKARSRTLRA